MARISKSGESDSKKMALQGAKLELKCLPKAINSIFFRAYTLIVKLSK